MNEVFKELSHRDRGAAKPLKERLDELKRQKNQEQVGAEWATKAQTLLAQPRLNLADALAWQRDAARAGAPLSKEPLADLKRLLAERVKAIEDLQHRVQVEREAAVLIAQRIEVLSTKPWKEAQLSAESLHADVLDWQSQTATVSADPQWPSVEPRFPAMLDASRQQLLLVWDAFEAALNQAVLASADPQAPLPAVPVWADELQQARGVSPDAASPKSGQAGQLSQEKRARAQAELEKALQVLETEVAQGHGKATPKAAADVRSALKSLSRLVGPELEARAHAALAQAGELEGWQRWRADQIREELVAKAEGLLQAPEGKQLGGRKMQETLRGLREQWKATDQGGQPNHALWKRFDEACTEAHKVVEAWLAQIRQQAEVHKAQRLEIIQALKAWTESHAANTDWKAQIRDLHGFSERWREAGHLSEKAFAELQPQWKEAMQQAHVRLEAAQAESIARRKALIEEATALGSAPQLRIDAVKALQQRWQAEAHAVPLERKHEQKLWEAFRQPIDEAFARKSSDRERAAVALSAHDQRVLDASKALEVATASNDVQRIRAAMQHLEKALSGQGTDGQAPEATASVEPTTASLAAAVQADSPAEDPPKQQTPAKKLVAVRGDDRPGMKKPEPAARDARRDRPAGRRDGGNDRFEARGKGAPGAGWRDDREPRVPRLGDAAFRAQRQALETAQASLRRLAEQAHGEVLTQVMSAWQERDPQHMPTAQALGTRVNAASRAAWCSALASAPKAPNPELLLRLEMAAEVPTPAEHLSERRMLQLQLLTRRHAAAPLDTWTEDVAALLATPYQDGAARRLQTVLKALLGRR